MGISDVHRSDTRSGSSAWCCLLAETHGYEEQVDCYCLYHVPTTGKRVVDPIDHVKVRRRSQRCLAGGLGDLRRSHRSQAFCARSTLKYPTKRGVISPLTSFLDLV